MWPWKDVPRDQGEDLLHLPAVVDILGKYVLVQRIAGRAVDKQQQPILISPRQFAEEIPSPVAVAGGAALLQLLPRPKDGPLGTRVKPFGVEQGPLVMIPQEADPAIHDQVDALPRIRPVSDDVAQAENLLDPLRGCPPTPR